MGVVRSSTSSPEVSVTATTSSQSVTSRKELSPEDTLLLEEEVSSLGNAVSQVSSEAARMVTRRHWRKCLIGAEKEYSFLVRAILKYSTHHVFVRLVEEHAQKIIEAANDEFLDRAIESRLKTIGAKELVSMLARAGRLGYDENDVVDEDETVIPVQEVVAEMSEPEIEEIPKPSSERKPPPAYGTDPLLDEQNRSMLAAASAALSALSQPVMSHPTHYPMPHNANLPTRRKAKDGHKYVCPDCQSTFTQSGGLQYHIERKVCHKPPANCRWFCDSCGKGFTTSGGKLYHEQNKVCATHETAKATPQRVLPQNTPAGAQQNHPYIQSAPVQHNGVGSTSYNHGTNVPYPQYIASPSQTQLASYSEVQRSSSPYSGIPATFTSTNRSPSWTSQGSELQTYHSHQPPRTGGQASNNGTLQSSPALSAAAESPQSDAPALDARAQAEMNSKIAAEVARFEQRCREIPDTLTTAERDEEINKQKRGHATRKSQIRKKFGIQVRSSKLRPANFGTRLSQEGCPSQAQASHISSFKAPAAPMASSIAASAPDSGIKSRAWPFDDDSDPKRRRIDDLSAPNNVSGKENRPDQSNNPVGWQRRIIPLSSRQDQSSEEIESDEPSKSTKDPEQEVSSAKSQIKKVPVAAAQKKWEALQPSKHILPPSQHRVAPEPSSSTGKAAEFTIAISALSSDDESDFDPDEEIPAKRPIGAVSRARPSSSSLSTSPAPMPAPRGGVSTRGSTKRKDSGIFASSLPKGKMLPAVQV